MKICLHPATCLRLAGLAMVAALAATGCGDRQTARQPSAGPDYAFITNGVADFWNIGKAGAERAADHLGVGVTVIMPASITDQTRKVEDLLTRGTGGIAISPINPANQGEILAKAAAATNLITHDSDAPDSPRRVYIGMDNYEAGILCGKLVREALPEGGKVMLFIGRLDQDNSQRRRQGCVDGILGREPDATRRDGPGDVLTSVDGKYTILGTMTDQFDRAKAKANAEDALLRHADVAAMVGLFEYNPPLILEALERAGRLREVKVIAFDESQAVLQGIADGTVVGTVVQNPFQYGYRSVEVLHALAAGQLDAIPESRFVNIPARVVLADDSRTEFAGAEVVPVATFRDQLKKMLTGSKAAR
jgi:ribose transport system substrate-binding protein